MPHFGLSAKSIVRIAILCLLTVSAGYAAVNCGAVITTNLKLTNDMSPCPGDGLILEGHDLTIDLNGHAIVGVSTGVGIRLSPIAYNITIKGPGTIYTFGTGVQIGASNTNVVIYGINFYENNAGVTISQTSKVRVFRNTLDGGSDGQFGAIVGECDSVYIYQNLIKRNYTAGVYLQQLASAFVDSNTITQNFKGIKSDFQSSATVRGNNIYNNEDNGIEFDFTFGTIEDNTVTKNGSNGIVVGGNQGSGILVQDNVVLNNNGIGIDVVSTNGGGNQVKGNYLQGNITDLFWNGLGSNNCWFQNVFTTSSAPSLPQCP